MKLSAKEVLKTTLPLLIICILVAAALGVTDLLTKDAIAELAEEKEMAARLEVLPDAVTFEALECTDAECTMFQAFNGEKSVGYIVTAKGNGYGGAVKVMVGFTNDCTVTGVKILSQNETVGLGANCEKESFLSQYVQEIPADGFSVYKKGAAAPKGGIEALTSATVTSKAVTAAVNSACEQLKRELNGGKSNG